MGRRKKPAELHRIHGTGERARLNKDAPAIEPVSDIEKLERPLWLDPDAVAAWDELLPILIRMGVFTIADRHLLIALCCAISRLKAAQREIEADGLVVHGATGSKKSPGCTIADEATKVIRALSGDLGLSPVSRPGLHANPPQELTEEEKKAEATALRLLGPNRYK